MDLFLKSALGKHEEDILQKPKVLLLYEDKGFVNSTMELMRIAARKVSTAVSVAFAIWDFDLITEPLLTRVAAREACAADMIIVVLRAGDSLPGGVKGWLRLWLLAHPWAFVGRAGSGSNWECFDCAPASINSQVENVGELGDMNILAIGGSKTSALASFKNEMTDALLVGIQQPFSLAARGVSSTRASGQNGVTSRRPTASVSSLYGQKLAGEDRHFPL